MIKSRLFRRLQPAKTFVLACVFTAAMPLMVCCQQKSDKNAEAKGQPGAAAATDSLAGYPAQKGFNLKESDPKAIEIADRMMEKMGGYRAWHDARYIGWNFFGQYQIWDKHASMFRHEQGNTVVVMNLLKPQGRVYVNGIEHNDSLEVKSLLDRTYIFWSNNTYWLALPYKLKDTGVTLKYKGEGKTRNGEPADILSLTFKEVGITPNNRHDVYVSKETGLITEWAFFNEAKDTEPSFIRNFDDYKSYNGVLLSTNRDSDMDTISIHNIAVKQEVPDEVFFMNTPGQRLK